MVRRSSVLLRCKLNREARSAFKKAAQLWMDDTCIDFQEYRDEASDYAERGWEEDDGERTARGEENEQHGEENILDYEQQMEGGGMEYEEGLLAQLIFVFMKEGCSSRVGRQEGFPLQFLSLGQGCETVYFLGTFLSGLVSRRNFISEEKPRFRILF
ncbi:hypothetical protein OSTOST_18167 [Ostertagia ostertagi]